MAASDLNGLFNPLTIRLNTLYNKRIVDTTEYTIFDNNEYIKIIEDIETGIFIFDRNESASFIRKHIAIIEAVDSLGFSIVENVNENYMPWESIEDNRNTLYDQIQVEIGFYRSRLNELDNFIAKKLISSLPSKEVIVKSFGFGKDHVPSLASIYNGLNFDSGDFINKERTTQQVFIDALTIKNLSTINGTIHFACETTQVAYILKTMRRWSKEFTFSNIERSKLFYTKTGEFLTATNISKSGYSEPKQKEYIDLFFAKLLLKQ